VLAVAAIALALVPGCQLTPVDSAPFTRISDDYRSDRYAAFNRLVRAWALAVGEGDVPAVLDLYAPEAVVQLHRAGSGEDLGPSVSEWVQDVESVMTGPADFDVGGDLAYGSVRVLVRYREGGRRAGLMSLVLREDADGWRIRGQLLALRP
jgi:ketosteroid isomerase-like protein